MVKRCTSNSLSVAANLRDTVVPLCTRLGETVGGTVMMITSPGLAGGAREGEVGWDVRAGLQEGSAHVSDTLNQDWGLRTSLAM